MKILKYNMTQRTPEGEEIQGAAVIMDYSEANLAIAKAEAWQGEVTIEDDGQPDPASIPTQLDMIEAQVTYTAMMTDTLLEA